MEIYDDDDDVDAVVTSVNTNSIITTIIIINHHYYCIVIINTIPLDLLYTQPIISSSTSIVIKGAPTQLTLNIPPLILQIHI